MGRERLRLVLVGVKQNIRLIASAVLEIIQF